MTFKACVVTWMDAWGTDSQVDADNVSHKPVETETIGWLIREDEVGVTVAMDCYPDTPDEARNTAFIPRGMVRKVRYPI